MSKSTFLSALLVVVTLNVLIATPVPWQVRALAAFLLTVPVLGYLFTLALGVQRHVSHAEHLLFAAGSGYALTVLLLLMLSYLPGGLRAWQTLVAFDLLAAVLLITAVSSDYRLRRAGDGYHSPELRVREAPSLWFWLGLGALLLVASGLRVPGLSYSEFQDDEVSVVWHAAEVIQGREDALFIHDKGPAEILITSAGYSLADRINEASARFPFAVANLVALLAVFWLGWRIFGPVAGWVAAMVLAVDGYFIGFSRIVQYQSLVFLMVVLVAGILHIYATKPRTTPVLLYLAALFFATGVLAHFEAVLVVVPGLYLVIKSWQHRDSVMRSASNLVFPALLSLMILLLFYVPFGLHPRFARTFSEITGNRIGTGFPYNNLADFFTRTVIYSSTYYFALMTVALMAALIVTYRRTLPARLFWPACIVLVAAVVGFFLRPEWATVQGADYAWLLFLLALAPAIFARRMSVGERATWLWFSAAFIVAIFVTQKPRTHVYDFIIPMALLIGNVAGLTWHFLQERLGRSTALAVGLPVAAALTILFGNYGYWLFVHNDVEVLRTWQENRPAMYLTPMKEARQNAIFGFPFKNGWKVVGALYDEGALDGPFARNGKRGVSNWYTRASEECPRDARYFVFTPWNEPTNKGLTDPPERPLQEDGYTLIHVVTVHGEPRLEIFDRSAPAGTLVQEHDVADYEALFDAELSGPIFEEPGAAGWTNIQHPLDFRLGSNIRLKGYTLYNKEAAAGERVDLTLYWTATSTPETSYKVFTQIIDPVTYHKAGQRDGVPACERHPTDRWLPGDTIVDRYSIAVQEDAPPGDYSLLIGMYDDAGELLEIFTNQGQSLGDSLGIDTITVVDK